MRLYPLFSSLVASATLLGCAHAPLVDKPHLAPGARFEDVPFHSTLLDRDMPYRVILPAAIPAGAKLPVVWLFHGADANYRSWSNETDIAQFAVSRNVILVTPEGRNSFYIDTATHRRYQSYLVEEVIPDVRRRFPFAATDRAQNAAIGISRGGYAAVILALKHPELFSYVAAMSGAHDLAERTFRWSSPLSSINYRRAYGPPGSMIRRDNDPFVLLDNVHARQQAPYFYLVCGDKDELLPSTQRLAAALAARGMAAEMHISSGNHDWGFWSEQLPTIEVSLAKHLDLAKHFEPAVQTP